MIFHNNVNKDLKWVSSQSDPTVSRIQTDPTTQPELLASNRAHRCLCRGIRATRPFLNSLLDCYAGADTDINITTVKRK